MTKTIEATPDPVAFDGMMTFGSGGNYLTWAGTGWSTPERNLTWIDGYQATLEFGFPAPDGDQMLAVTAMPVQAGIAQHMQIYLNGRFVGLFVRQRGLEEKTFPIDREYFNRDGSKNTLAFVCLNAVKPADVGAGTRSTHLELRFHVAVAVSGGLEVVGCR